MRLGVRTVDFQEHDLIELPVKHSDARAAGFVNEHGHRCAEIDAIPPTELRRRVEAAIVSHIDPQAWERLKVVEAAEQQTLNTFVKKIRASENGSRSSSDGADKRARRKFRRKPKR
jgi:hypothetical protein